MQSALGNYFEQQRKEKKISLNQLPGRLGYRKNKARRLWEDFINTGICSPDFLQKAAVAFDVPEDMVEVLIESDIYAAAKMARETEKDNPYLATRINASFYSRGTMPDGLTLDQAEAFAGTKARERSLRTCLVWGRRFAVYFDANGEVEGRINSTPWWDARP